MTPGQREVPAQGGHEWIRTVPTDGRWCELCGLAYARWSGDECPGEGAARVVEAELVKERKLRRQVERERDAAVSALTKVREALVELYRREAENGGHGRSGHLNEDDLALIAAAFPLRRELRPVDSPEDTNDGN